MDELNIVKTNEETDEEVEGKEILSNAEDLIKQSDSNGRKQKSKKFLWFFVVPLFVLIVLALVISTIFALVNLNNSNIMNGVFIEGIDVSGLSKEQAKEKVSSIINSHLTTEITLSYEDFTQNITFEQIGASFDVDTAVETAYSVGRGGNLIENNYSILNALLQNVQIEQSFSFDKDLLSAISAGINEELPGKTVNPDYYVDGTTLTITKGSDGVAVDEDALSEKLLVLLDNVFASDYSIEIPVKETQAAEIDINEIYKSVYKEPVDAYYTTNPYVVHPSSTGLDFKISIEEATELLNEDKEEYTIPLKVTYPSVSTNDIGSEAFPDLLGKFSTSFTSSNNSRSTNIRLAAKKINGLVLMPGETFSFNQSVGKRTAAAGFQPAPAYNNGETVLEYGGGICQVSSTLYNAVLYANLEITERTNHGYKPSYVKPGLDATVSWGGPDFKFTNNRDYPIRIVTDTSSKILKIYIYGLKKDSDYTVVLDAQYISTVYATTTYKKDSSLAKGETKVIQSGSNGCKTATYKYLYNSSGTLVSSECISRDTYNPHNKIIAVGE